MIIFFIVYGILTVGSLLHGAYMHGKPKKEKHSFWGELIGVTIQWGIVLGLLVHWGLI